MSERWVVNASPLIVLARINQADLLRQLADEIAFPKQSLMKSTKAVPMIQLVVI